MELFANYLQGNPRKEVRKKSNTIDQTQGYCCRRYKFHLLRYREACSMSPISVRAKDETREFTHYHWHSLIERIVPEDIKFHIVPSCVFLWDEQVFRVSKKTLWWNMRKHMVCAWGDSVNFEAKLAWNWPL